MRFTFPKLFYFKVLSIVFNSSHLMKSEDVKSRDTFVTFDSDGTTVMLEREILSDGAGTVSYEVVGGVNGVVGEEIMDKVVKRPLTQNITGSP